MCLAVLPAQTEDPLPGSMPAETPSDETAAVPPPPQALTRYFAAGGSIFLFIDDQSIHSEPTPLFSAFYFTVAFPFYRLNRIAFYANISLDMYLAHYLWSEDRARPLPASVDNRDARIFGFPFSLTFEVRSNLNKRFSIHFNTGLSMDLRGVMLAEDLNPAIEPIDEIKANKEKISDYFWNDLRWLFFEFSGGFVIQLVEDFSLDINTRMFLPVGTVPGQDDDPSLMNWRFAFGLRVVKYF